MHTSFRISLVLALLAGPVLAEEVHMPEPTRQALLEKQAQFGATPLTTKVFKMTFPQGYKTPLHTHEGPGPRYVVRGQVKIEEGGTSRVYGPGEVFWETGQWMSAENVGQGDAEVLIVELIAPK